MHVKIIVADAAAALVAGTDAHFLAAVALEWGFCVLEFERVLGVAEVGNFVVPHGGFDQIKN